MISALGRILNSLLGRMTNTAEAIADANAIPELQQNVRTGKERLDRASGELAVLVGKIRVAENKVAGLERDIARDEKAGDEALAIGREDLARDLSMRVSAAAREAETERKSIATMKAAAVEMKGVIDSLEANLKSVEREISQVQVRESVLSATDAILESGAGAKGSIGNAADTLKRIKERQEGRQATADARRQIADARNGGDLDRRLAEAGLVDGHESGDAVLARLKAKRAALAAPEAQKALPDGEKA